ncbi:MAG: phosphoribosylformylglycinamidine synthase II, partial [Chloroflexi bacterium]|nr:phosphoribosylformylglycinamidine synthase II [Chloroflexota bacterium]
ELEVRLQRLVLAAHGRGLLRAAHDRAEGGLAVALAELCLREKRGMTVTLPAQRGVGRLAALFGESPTGGIVLVCAPEDADALRTLAKEQDVPVWTLGTVGGDLLEVAPILAVNVAAMADAFEHGLARALGRA